MLGLKRDLTVPISFPACSKVPYSHKLLLGGCSNAHLLSPCSGDRDRQLSEFEASLVYRVQDSQGYTEKSYLKKKKIKTTKEVFSCEFLFPSELINP
jgi:hypothetical protein